MNLMISKLFSSDYLLVRIIQAVEIIMFSREKVIRKLQVDDIA